MQGLKTVVLDAMGVIYRAGDDVADLLCPFIREHSGKCDDALVQALYLELSLGRISSPQFWERLGLESSLEDKYLLRHALSAGVLDFLKAAKSRMRIWCLSNDASDWSRKLRERFELSKLIGGFLISGDVGVRKPNPLIFHHLLKRLDTDPGNVIFVDDRRANLDAAAALGLQTVLFGGISANGLSPHASVANFMELREMLFTEKSISLNSIKF